MKIVNLVPLTLSSLAGVVLVLVLGGCGSKGGGGEEVIAKLAALEKAMCGCADEACAKKVRAEHAAYTKGGAMKKPTDEQMNTVMDTETRSTSARRSSCCPRSAPCDSNR